MTSTHKKAKIQARRTKAESKRRGRYKHTCPKCRAKKRRRIAKRHRYLVLKDKYGKSRAKEMLK